MARMHAKKGTFFFKYFFVLSAIILVSYIIIGTALMLFVTDFLKTENLDDTALYARNISETTAELIESSTSEHNPEGAALVILNSVDLMADSTGDDVFICNTKGEVIACPEMLTEFTKNPETCEKHSDITIPKAYIQKAQKGGASEFSTLNSIYSSVHSISIEPINVDDEFIGFTVVSAPVSGDLLHYLEQILKIFLGASAISILIVLIAVYFLTERVARPIRNLETATTCYSSGDFSYRVPELQSNDELAHLITKFNSMATALSQLEDSRRSFVANVSHEFKTPMTTIGGFINGILDGTIPPEKQDYYLNIVSSEINRLSKMVNTMLNISKIETGNISLTIEQFDISTKIVTTFLGFEQLISDKKIEITGLDDLTPAQTHGDSAMIDQAIYNLVDNAVKFTQESGKIDVRTTTDKNFVYFAITNSGKGIPEKDLRKVFERFYKVDRSRSTDVKSTGLGLYLIKSIIELHGGTITVESEVDNFTRFTVKLPK